MRVCHSIVIIVAFITVCEILAMNSVLVFFLLFLFPRVCFGESSVSDSLEFYESAIIQFFVLLLAKEGGILLPVSQ